MELKISKKIQKMDFNWLIDYKISKNKLVNRSVLVDKTGKIKTYYDKIHMYDVVLNKREKYFSQKLLVLEKNKNFNLPWGKLGLSICYDLRFPNMYRKLSKDGCYYISIPSAFTETTGKRHWHSLLKARAMRISAIFCSGARRKTL